MLKALKKEIEAEGGSTAVFQRDLLQGPYPKGRKLKNQAVTLGIKGKTWLIFKSIKVEINSI